MKNSERVMRDVGNVLYNYEKGRVSPSDSVKKLLEVLNLTSFSTGCRMCAYRDRLDSDGDRECDFDSSLKCEEGFEKWLEGEAL